METSLDYQYFFKYFNNFQKFDGTTFDLALAHVYNYATENGLSEEDLILITKVSFSQKLGVTRLRKLMKCLIPRCTVPEEVLDYVMEWLYENYDQNISSFGKKIVLQWFAGLIKYNIINPAKTIYSYYDFFWCFIKTENVSIAACNLIYLLAKPEDVNRWYVKQLLKYHKLFQQPKYTGALLLLFKSYRPDCVPENIPAYAVHKAFGNLPEFIVTHFSKTQERLESNNMIPKDIEGIRWHSTDIRNIKRNAVKLIPNVTECEMDRLDATKALTSITNVKDLHKYLIQGHSPNRIMSLLNNTEGCFILIFGDKTMHERFSFQLYYTLYDAFFERNPNVSYQEKDNLLNKLCILQNQMQQSIPVVSKFLAQYIFKWDGCEHENHIFGLLHWLNFKTYHELHESVLNILYNLFISGTVQTKSKILITIGHFTANIIKSFFYRIRNEMPFIFLDGDIKWKFEDLIYKLYEYVTQLCRLGYNFERSNSLILHAVLDVNFLIMEAEQNCDLQIWKIPDFLCYAGIFTSHPSCFRRIFSLFNRFPTYVSDIIKSDYIDTLWHKKAFTDKLDPSVFDIFSDTEIIQLKQRFTYIKNSLSCENHFALACFNFTLKVRNTKDKKQIQKFMEHAKACYPDIFDFLSHNI